jgi:hypothetical protein
METYVFDGSEVKKTGRTAVKTLVAGSRVKEMTLIEITPVDSTFDWKKWVRPEDLYLVKNKD